MLLGAMNNPMFNLIDEIETIADLGFDFIDLAMEPQAAYSGHFPVREARKSLDRTGLDVIGHTAWYLQIASPFPEIREAVLKEFERCLRVFHELGATMMNIHPHTTAPLHDWDWIISQNIAAISRLSGLANRLGMKIILENTPTLSRAIELRKILDAVPEVGFHLDVGHAHLDTPYNRSEELLAHFGDRLLHVHVSDNRGGHDDLHLPLGVGNINWSWVVKILKNANYDRGITVEVFGDDPDYLLISRDKLRQLWETIEAG
ncbi:MAG: sugar phosphate isomerase/epimerase [Armatimonadetes bacterium]|nr:sugar phosphate isomerase/epimerase [Armatimonadota bacterium]